MFKITLKKEENYIQIRRPNGEWVKMNTDGGKIVDRSTDKFIDVPVADPNYTSVPLVKIEELDFEDSFFQSGKNEWKASTLVKAAKDQKCKEFDLPICALDLRRMPFTIDDMDDVAFHFKRMINSDLRYPIILDSKGFIADGWHRVAKAIIEERRTIKAIRLNEMPPHDRINEEED